MTHIEVLRKTQKLNHAAAFLLSLQFYGNLYEENIAVSNVVNPKPGSLVEPLAAGSPLYFYIPWVLIGLTLVVALYLRLRRLGAYPAIRDLKHAFASLVIVIAAKTFLVTQINDKFRVLDSTTQEFVRAGWIWLGVNAVAIIAGGYALWKILYWRSAKKGG